MGSYAYDYLNDSLLLDPSLIKIKFQTVSEDRLRLELQNYREYCLKDLTQTAINIKPSSNILSCMATNTMASMRALKQAALYLEQIVVTDPIFELTDFKREGDVVYSKFIGLETDGTINRDRLVTAAHQLIQLRPLVAGGYVKLYPATLEHEKGENLPVLFSSNGFEDCLPEYILEQYKTMANIRSVKAEENILKVMKDLYPCRRISIDFKGMEGGFAMGYALSEATYKATSEKNRYEMTQHIPDTIPSQENFNIWVKQSVNQTALNHYKDLTTRIALSHNLGSMFCSEHEFESQLLNINFERESKDIPANTINSVMSMDLPFLNNVSATDLMNIRNNDGEQFNSFRVELEKSVRAARHESDPLKVKQIVADAQHELFEVQVNQISPLIKNIKKTHFAEASIGLLGVGASIATSGLSLFATFMAALQGAKSHSDYMSKVHSNPCHFLWKVKNAGK